MAGGRPSFEKREREKAKRAKAQSKRDRRAERADSDTDAPEPGPDQLSEDELVERLRRLQEGLDAGQLDIDTFQAEREALMERFQV